MYIDGAKGPICTEIKRGAQVNNVYKNLENKPMRLPFSDGGLLMTLALRFRRDRKCR